MAAQRSGMTKKVLSLACVNFHAEWGNKAANLEKMKKMIAQAAQVGNEMIVFPELALSGYECDEGFKMHEATAETIPGPATEEMAKVAAEHDVYVIFGLPERDKDKPKARYISTAVVGPEGILGAYRKIHLSEPPMFSESLCFSPGREVPVFETRYGLIGIQICYDFWIFPELTRILALKGAILVINTTGSPSGPGKSYYLTTMTAARAAENGIYVASANLVGKEVKTSYFGHSSIAGPAPPRRVKLYAEGGEDEEIVSATLNLEICHWWRAQSNWQGAMRADIITEEMKKLKEGTQESRKK